MDVKHHVYLFTLPYSPSLISLVVSVDVKHHVYLHLHTPPPISPSLISLVVSMDVKHHVYLFIYTSIAHLPVPNKPCGFYGR